MKLKHALYVILIILINVAGTTLFFRADLTENNSYSLSDSSKNLVANLEEPLTIKVFLSENLPVPYNTLERDIRDILGEYKLKANKHFNYSIDLIKKDGENDVKPEMYGIYPVNIQSVEQDEMKVVSAYIGMSFIHGDLSHVVPAIQYNENLEFTITKTIRDLSEKTTALLGMEENIKVKVIMSPILKQLSSEISSYKNNMETVIQAINKDYFNRISFEYVEPEELEVNSLVEQYSLNVLNIGDRDGNTLQALASLIIESKDDVISEELISKNIFGSTTIASPQELDELITSSVDKMIGAGTQIGYLTGNGTIQLVQNQQMMMFNQSQDPGVSGMSQIINQSYSLKEVDITEGEIPDNIRTLIILRPKTAFSQRELYLLDQFILKGNSLLIALDQFEVDMQMAQYGQEKYNAIDHGLKDLLNHHGISVEENLVLDEASFKQRQQDNNGGLKETQIYFAPMIKQDNVNKDLTFLNGVNELLTLRNAEVKPVNPDDKSVKTLFTSSEKSWDLNSETITMDPNRMFPSAEQRKYSLGVIKEGDFYSYFADKEIPAREYKTSEEAQEDQISGVDEKETLIKRSDKGMIVVLGSSDMLTDQLISQNFQSNVLFFQNTLDYLSGRGDYTLMRSKGVFNRPMDDVSGAKRNFIKYFNIAGLPILVGLAGLVAYLLWTNKKRKIMLIFGGNDEK